ncbi:TPA: hypothetical protein SMP15_000675 [Proteus mirabilis]|nr:hypothetical protein [Proteus mirabilis]HEK0491444.1 hypothetical protein [Proteus mirabilis]HEK0523450.1 hypothetical protein [Proteus mirabilis]HEK3234287.1 hypothetical protein [Proteus mirabilis]HEK3244903.1 hypothetical protein [Proteus mirabilis]
MLEQPASEKSRTEATHIVPIFLNVIFICGGDLCSIEVINDHKYIGDFTVRFIVTEKSNINGKSLK